MLDQKHANIEAFQETLLPQLLNEPLMRGKFVIVHEQKVKGAFDTFDAALREAVTRFPVNEFVIQQILEPNSQINFIHAAL